MAKFEGTGKSLPFYSGVSNDDYDAARAEVQTVNLELAEEAERVWNRLLKQRRGEYHIATTLRRGSGTTS